MAFKETNVEKDIQLALSPEGSRLFKNVRGVFFRKGDREQKYPIAVGVGPNGGSDLIGYTIMEIEPHMVGRKIAVFTAIECKQGKGRAHEDQLKFCERVRIDGGKSGIAWSVDDAKEIIY